MSVLRYLFRNSFLRYGSYLVSVIAALIVTPILVRTLGNEEYGKWVLINTLLVYFMLFDFGYASSVARYVSRKYQEWGEDSARRCVATVFYALLGAMAVSLVLLAAAYQLLRTRYLSDVSDEMIFSMGALAVSYSVVVPLRLFHGVLRSQLKWNTISLITMLKAILLNFFMVILVLNGYGLYAVIIPNGAAIVLEYLAYFIMARRAYDFSLNPKLFEFRILKDVSKYSFSLSLYFVSFLVGGKVQAYFIALYISLPQVTVYTIGVQLLNYFDELMLSIFDILMPYFSGHEDEPGRLVDEFITISSFCFMVASFGGFMIWSYAPSFLYFWIGPQLVHSSVVVDYLVIPYVVCSSLIPGRGLALGTSTQGFMVKLAVVECALKIGLMLYVVPKFGMIGMLWCMVVTMLLFRGILFAGLQVRKMRIPWTRYLYRVYCLPLALLLVPQGLIRYFLFPRFDRFSYEIGYVFTLNLVVFGATLAGIAWRNVKRNRRMAEPVPVGGDAGTGG